MPNQVHLIAVPSEAEGLGRAIGQAHRRYTRRINFRKGWRGHLWQGRFASFVMDDDWAGFLAAGTDPQEQERLRRHEQTGRPLGSERFIKKLEKTLGRVLRPQKGGRPRKKRN